MPAVALDIQMKIPRGMARDFNKARKEVNREAGVFWHRTILDRHFKQSARAEYQYEPRDERYLRKKRFIGVGQGKFMDLILSGQSRRFAQHNPTITSTSRSARVKMKLPNKLIANRARPGTPSLIDEITRVSRRDRQDLGDFMVTRLTEETQKLLESAK